MIKAAIIGATGFTGSELVRILLGHPDVELIGISSESRAGEPFPAVHPQFEGFCDLTLVKAEEIAALGPDICFLALPQQKRLDSALLRLSNSASQPRRGFDPGNQSSPIRTSLGRLPTLPGNHDRTKSKSPFRRRSTYCETSTRSSFPLIPICARFSKKGLMNLS